MKKNILYIMGISFLLGLSGCEQLDVNRYENDPRLYFFNGYDNTRTPTYYHQDSIAQSFFLLPAEQERDTVFIVLETMGMPSDEPRPFRLVQTNEGEPDAAVSGKHYLPFDSEEMKRNMMIPAGAVRYYMPLIVLRDPSLEISKVRLKIGIGENEYFKQGIDEELEFMVTITATAEEPPTWDDWYFGDWGPKKMWFVINYVGITDFMDVSEDSAYLNYLKAFAIQKLREYNADPGNPDTPLTEADGTVVTFE